MERPGIAVLMPRESGRGASLSIRLSAAIVAATIDEPRVLTVRIGHDPDRGIAIRPVGGRASHPRGRVALLGRTADGPKARLCRAALSFGDRDRVEDARAGRALTVAYLALVREARPGGAAEAVWQSWYRYFPWEDWRSGQPATLPPLETRLGAWVRQAAGDTERRLRAERLGLAFARSWNEDLVLERYELLYEAGLIQESWRDLGRLAAGRRVGFRRRYRGRPPPDPGDGDGPAVRGKIKYRPVIFELLAPTFTLSRLQRTAEALAGLRLHTGNFRRLVEGAGLVEGTGRRATRTGGRPAEEFRFRREVLLERPAPGVRVRPRPG